MKTKFCLQDLAIGLSVVALAVSLFIAAFHCGLSAEKKANAEVARRAAEEECLIASSSMEIEIPFIANRYERETAACERLASKYGVPKSGIEYVLPDSSRVDLLSETHAWEVDWAHKWPEGIGQAIYYSIWTGKKPGLILLVRDQGAEKHYLIRAKMVCQELDIELAIEQSEETPDEPRPESVPDAAPDDREVVPFVEPLGGPGLDHEAAATDAAGSL